MALRADFFGVRSIHSAIAQLTVALKISRPTKRQSHQP